MVSCYHVILSYFSRQVILNLVYVIILPSILVSCMTLPLSNLGAVVRAKTGKPSKLSLLLDKMVNIWDVKHFSIFHFVLLYFYNIGRDFFVRHQTIVAFWFLIYRIWQPSSNIRPLIKDDNFHSRLVSTTPNMDPPGNYQMTAKPKFLEANLEKIIIDPNILREKDGSPRLSVGESILFIRATHCQLRRGNYQ